MVYCINKLYPIPVGLIVQEIKTKYAGFFYTTFDIVIKQPKEEQQQIFMAAAMQGQTEIIKMMKNILKPSDFETDTPLHRALMGGCREAVELLLEYKARVGSELIIISRNHCN